MRLLSVLYATFSISVSILLSSVIFVACDNNKSNNNSGGPGQVAAPPSYNTYGNQYPGQPMPGSPGYGAGGYGGYPSGAYPTPGIGVNPGAYSGQVCPNNPSGGYPPPPTSLGPNEIFRGFSEGPQHFPLMIQWSVLGDPARIQEIRNYFPGASVSRSYRGLVTALNGQLMVKQLLCDQEGMLSNCYQNNGGMNGSIGNAGSIGSVCVIPPGNYTLSLAQPGQWMGRTTSMPEIVASGPVQFVMSLNNGGVYFDSMCAKQDRIEGHIRIVSVNGHSCSIFGTYIN